jgi:dTDP-4-dehydrorhamnose 3,5-epimerase
MVKLKQLDQLKKLPTCINNPSKHINKVSDLKIIATSIPDILLIEPTVFPDERGFFLESYQKKQFKELGIDFDFVQDNHSKSGQGTLRGLHYQIRQPQGKLVRVVAGEVFDVAVDIRRHSPTFGKWVGDYLSAENKRMLWVPPGFAHGFYVTSAEAEFLYKTTDYYAPQWERTILWNDQAIGIEWPTQNVLPILSPKDTSGKVLADAELFE